jgi:hypothetical protein
MSMLVPDLAADFGQVSSDKLTGTFHLKKGLKPQRPHLPEHLLGRRRQLQGPTCSV